MSAPTALYRRFRPATFTGLVGQESTAMALRNAVANDRVGHAYLFSGPRGCGKTSAARVLAAALNCADQSDGEPCGVCESCVTIANGTSPDVHEIDAASNSNVEAMRSLIAKVALGSPGRRKVYILDEAHMLSRAAAAALLKTLEEPPAHVVFVLATTNPENLPDTIASRTQQLKFRLIDPTALEQHLRAVATSAGIDPTDDQITAAVSAARGSARDALSALDAVLLGADTVDVARHARAIVSACCAADHGAALAALAEAVRGGVEPRDVIAACVAVSRDWFLVTQDAGMLASAPVSDSDAASASIAGPRRLVRCLEGFAELTALAATVDVRVAADVVVVRLCRMDTDATIAAHHEQLSALHTRVSALESARAA